MQTPDIWFPNLNIAIQNLPRIAFSVFGISIYWYAIWIMLGYFMALLTLWAIAKRTDQDPELYTEYIFYVLVFGLLGARIYFVIFSWESYRHDLTRIFAFREGGLAIYGGLILTGLYTIYFVRKKKVTYGLLSDTSGPAVAIGQVFGRMGNLFNREAFGGYTDTLLAIRFRVDQAYYIPAELYDKIMDINGVEYIQVHPAFLYEMLWNTALFAFLIWFRTRKRFDGQIFLFYCLGYGLGRFWIEGLRTDQLILFGTGLAVSQVFSAIVVVTSAIIIVYKLRNIQKYT